MPAAHVRLRPNPGSRAWIAIAAAAIAASAKGEVTGDPIDFARQIRPVLVENCFKCHGPDARARKAGVRLDRREDAVAELRGGGAAVVPGAPDASLLLMRVESHDDDVRMPPPDVRPRLDDHTISLLRTWIAQGAVYEPHWSFVAPVRPAPPSVGDTAWPRNAVDRFILARLESEDLAPSPVADRPTLIRRVSLDLTGLPPTPKDVDAFLDDESPDAYTRVVDRLLEDPAYGERWARVWLDLARYADTKGYEADRRRTIWPYRDWVIRALNEDVPYDRFTIEQLAGDLLEAPTPAQHLATAFHRNTMTNDEGGTDDEEFRTAAIVDRVNTTMQTWMGLTVGCAQCHDHKYDPISQREYYRLFAFLNTTQDNDAMDDKPTLGVPSAAQTAHLAALRPERLRIDARIETALAEVVDDEPRAPETREPANGFVWIDDDLPVGAEPEASGLDTTWTWTDADRRGGPPVRSGVRSMRRRADANMTAQHFFTKTHFPLVIAADDTLFVDVYLDPDDPPRQIMLQWHDGKNWEHRAYWGEDLIPFGADGAPSRMNLGALPATGAWIQLQIAADDVGLKPGDVVAGWAFTQHAGTVYWDRAGIRGATPRDDDHRYAQDAWESRVRALDASPLPEDLAAIVAIAPTERSGAQRDALRHYYLRNVHRPTRSRLAPLLAESDRLAAEVQSITRATPRVPVMREQPERDRRPTHVLNRGSFLDRGDAVDPGVPAIFPPLADDAPPTRLGFAQWLVSADNPLTARVAVNRLWEQLFGIGLVETLEDFGIQGAPPSHPELLDWLATELVADGWSMKRALRRIVMSSTYRQSSAVTPELLERDPRNRLLARGPRLRLEAEMLRDQALAVSGLLSDAMYGPPVFPAQPDGVWQIIYSDDTWTTSTGPDRHRRALYTFWRRTSPYPSTVTFDAPSREFCVPRRIRTNTPLQALVTLNDPVYVEAAQALARRIVAEADPDPAARVARGVALCLGRRPRVDETRTLVGLHDDVAAELAATPEAATTLATDPLGPLDDDADPVELATWTVVANVLLNLDEFLVKE